MTETNYELKKLLVMKAIKFFPSILTSLVIMFSSAAIGGNSLTFYDSCGQELIMPVQQEATESLPFDAGEQFQQSRLADVSQVIDLSDMIKPEAEVNDISIDLKAVYNEISK